MYYCSLWDSLLNLEHCLFPPSLLHLYVSPPSRDLEIVQGTPGTTEARKGVELLPSGWHSSPKDSGEDLRVESCGPAWNDPCVSFLARAHISMRVHVCVPVFTNVSSQAGVLGSGMSVWLGVCRLIAVSMSN